MCTCFIFDIFFTISPHTHFYPLTIASNQRILDEQINTAVLTTRVMFMYFLFLAISLSSILFFFSSRVPFLFSAKLRH